MIIMIKITESAIEKIKNLDKSGYYFRVFVRGGGCSGFQYGFELDDPTPDDLLINDLVLVDQISKEYLKGSILDYVKDLSGEYFILKNPNTKTTCGCGQSFSV